VASRVRFHHTALLPTALLACLPALASTQALSVHSADGHLRIRAPGFTFLKGEPLARLKDGRSVRVELTLTVLPAPGATALVTVRRIFGLSYDLWEERFAVTTGESPLRTISHLTDEAAEAWCIEQTSVPLSALESLRGDASFWVRLESRILNPDAEGGADEGPSFTLQALIDALSRRRGAEAEGNATQGGPFRLPSGGGRSSRR